MPLLDAELARIKHELGFNLLSIGAEPYIGITRVFEQVVLPNLSDGALTTSATDVVAVTAGAPPSPVTLTLASATGFAMMAQVIVDVDGLQETSTVQSVSGDTITVPLRYAHSGTYPVAVESGVSMVREYLARLRKVALAIERFGPRAGIKKVNEIEFFGGASGRAVEASGYQTLSQMQRAWRRELCMMLFGVGSIGQLAGGGSRMSVY